jgi:hypothetical protein
MTLSPQAISNLRGISVKWEFIGPVLHRYRVTIVIEGNQAKTICLYRLFNTASMGETR